MSGKTTYLVKPTISDKTYHLIAILSSTDLVLEHLILIIKQEDCYVNRMDVLPEMFVAIQDAPFTSPTGSSPKYEQNFVIYHRRLGRIAYVEVTKEIF